MGLIDNARRGWQRLTAPRQPSGGPPGAKGARTAPPSEREIESGMPFWGGVGNVHRALAFAPLHRCVALISEVVSELITGPTLRVVDRDNRRVTGRLASRVIDLVAEEPDAVLSPHQYWTCAVVEYLLGGNSIHEIMRDSSGLPDGLRRLDSWDAEVRRTTSRSAVYIGTADSRTVTVGARNIIHARWPIPRYPGLGNSLGGADRRDNDLACSPLLLLWPATELGIRSDGYVRRFFEGGPEGALQARTIITMPPSTSDEAMEETAKEFIRAGNDLSPAVVKDGTKVDALKHEPGHNKDIDLLRTFQARDVSRVYGMVAPLIGEEVTSWGAGIEQLARLAYRFGFRQHLFNLLNPLSWRLLPRGQRFAINDLDLLRGDADSMARLAQLLVQAESTTKEEVRMLVGLPAEIPDGEIVRSVQVRATGGEQGSSTNGNRGRMAGLLDGDS